MYFDLFLPFPLPAATDAPIKKNKGKFKVPPLAATGTGAAFNAKPETCWDGIDVEGREAFARRFGLAGHLGYDVVAPTIVREAEATAWPSPFHTLPYPHLDPRQRHTIQSSASPGTSNGESSTAAARGQSMVQVTRYHFKLDDAKTHPLSANSTNILHKYDILSCQPTNEKALQLACLDFSNPGPNQLSIITLPLHERPYHFRLNRKQINQAQRNGVVLEILYAAALCPPAHVSPETARRYRQNWMTNAREIVRITGGKGVIFSSGPGGGSEGMRSPADLINLATVLGMPANIAKDAVSLGPKMVLLKAQARRTFKAVLSAPRLVPPPGDGDSGDDTDTDESDIEVRTKKRSGARQGGGRGKKRKSAAKTLVPTA